MNDAIVVGTVVEGERLTLVEACRYCGTSREAVVAIVAEGIVDVEGARPEEWAFDTSSPRRLRRALRLRRELELESAGVALALDLFDELDEMRRRLAMLEYQLKR